MAYVETVETGDGCAHGTTPLLLVKEKKRKTNYISHVLDVGVSGRELAWRQAVML